MFFCFSLPIDLSAQYITLVSLYNDAFVNIWYVRIHRVIWSLLINQFFQNIYYRPDKILTDVTVSGDCLNLGCVSAGRSDMFALRVNIRLFQPIKLSYLLQN